MTAVPKVQYEVERLQLGELNLDPSNPRLAQDSTARSSPRNLIHELFHHEDAMSLAVEIAEHGYSPLENIVVSKQDVLKQRIVFEGNRRIAACKALVSPDLAPEKYRKQLRVLHGKVEDGEFDRIPAVEVSGREAASYFIASKHTRVEVKKWSLFRQADYYYSIYAPTSSIQTVVDATGAKEGDVVEQLRRNDLYHRISRLNMADDVREAFHKENFRLYASTLDRFVNNDPGTTYLGLKDGKLKYPLQSTLDEAEFEKRLLAVLTRIVRKKLNTRSLNSVPGREAFLIDVERDLKAKTDSTATNSEDSEPSSNGDDETKNPDAQEGGNANSKEESKGEGKDAKKKGKGRKSPETTIPDYVECNSRSPKIRDLFQELQKLNSDDCPIVAAMGTRALLEISLIDWYKRLPYDGHTSLYAFLTADGKKRLQDKFDKQVTQGKAKISVAARYTLGLSELVGYLRRHPDLVEDHNLHESFFHNYETLKMYEALNFSAHKLGFHVDGPKVRLIMRNTLELLVHIWNSDAA